MKETLKTITLLLLLYFFCCGCNENFQEQENLSTQEQNLVWSPQSWASICLFFPCTISTSGQLSANGSGRSAEILGRLAIYGRAVAQISGSGNTCTASLIDDEHLVTARHCVVNGGFANITAVFGLYGVTSNGTPGNLNNTARYRLRQLLGRESACVNNVSNATLTNWQCSYHSSSYTGSEGNRDIVYYRCNSKPICGATVLPGYLFGHLKTGPAQESSINNGFGVTGISVNSRLGEIFPHSLLSPKGIITDDGEPWFPGGWGGCGIEINGWDYESCFELREMDNYCGSSGQPIFHYHAPVAYEVLGILSGTQGDFDLIINPGDPIASCTSTPQTEQNPDYLHDVAMYTTNKIRDFKNFISFSYVYDFLRGSFVYAGAVGGSGGTQAVLRCPNYLDTEGSKYVAVGIIGTTSSSNFAGNFGIVCSPIDTLSPRQLDQTKTAWGGSSGVARLVNMTDFNTAWNENLANEANSTYIKQQHVHLCAPDEYLRGMVIYGGSYVNRVSQIICENYTNGTTIYRGLSQSFEQSVGTSTAGTYQVLDCRSASGGLTSFVIGANVMSAAWTDNIALWCRNRSIY